MLSSQSIGEDTAAYEDLFSSHMYTGTYVHTV